MNPARQADRALNRSGVDRRPALTARIATSCRRFLTQKPPFLDHATITRFQLADHAQNWIAGRQDEPLVLDSGLVLQGDPHQWTDTLQISVHFPITPEQIEEARRGRDEGHEMFSGIFRRWQSEQGRRFQDWFQEEADGLGRSLWEGYLDYLRRWNEVVTGVREPTTEDILPGPPAETVQDVLRVFQQAGLSTMEALPKVQEFLFSPTLRDVPVVKVQALLFAALAHQAATGRRRLPSRGTFTDIRIVATLLAYCDAMLLDNEIRTLLTTGPVRERLDFPTRLFSRSNLDEFLKFLDDIEGEATAEHLALVEELYGEVEPFTMVFELEEP